MAADFSTRLGNLCYDAWSIKEEVLKCLMTMIKEYMTRK